MARVHPTSTISPTKLEIVRSVLASADWFDGDPDSVESGRRFSYRFDDPAGLVGVEVVMVHDGDRVLQVPLTYREGELVGADEWFLTHMDHSVLGQRWIYDGAGDPVLVGALVTAALTGARQEDFEVDVDGERQVFPAAVQVRGTGSESAPEGVRVLTVSRDAEATSIETSEGTLVLPHVVGSLPAEGRAALVGSWPDGPGQVTFAILR